MLKLTIYCDVIGCDNEIVIFAETITSGGNVLLDSDDMTIYGWDFFDGWELSDEPYRYYTDGVYCHECRSRVKRSGKALDYCEQWKFIMSCESSHERGQNENRG